ncbi:MAG: T9SS type A sorting domain-containing protein [Bacteroidales bacterium]|nr:T9SS type A sorting domain-containing protein [Bacteroidales bacterium]
MKKILFITLAIVISMAANAQNQVWDGTAEPWTHGSGTEEDPYLIETPQNLAYLAVMVNGEPGVALNHMFPDTCFLLTADIDLGGQNGLVWNPIGTCTHYSNSVGFSGHFDGGGHAISNMTVTNETSYYYNYYGLFGYAKEGSIKNVVLDLTCSIQLKDCYEYWGIFVGGVVGYGTQISVINCHSDATIEATETFAEMDQCSVGGVCGILWESSAAQCSFGGYIDCDAGSRYANVTLGGITGGVRGCEVTGCHNDGWIVNKTKTHIAGNWGGFVAGGIAGTAIGDLSVISHCGNNGRVEVEVNPEVYFEEGPAYSGGILGYAWGRTNSTLPVVEVEVRNCYNVADLSVNPVDDAYIHTAAGGIVGGVDTYARADVSNCYHVGGLTAEHTGGILVPAGDSASVTNSYFIDGCCCDNGFGEPQTEGFMKSAEFVSLLNAGGEVFAMDTDNVNGGFPVFADGGHFNVIENQIDGGGVSAYPNPAAGSISVVVNSGAEIGSVSLFDISGRLVKVQQSGFGSIDISGLATGMYVMKVTLDDGKVFEEKIVKK